MQFYPKHAEAQAHEYDHRLNTDLTDHHFDKSPLHLTFDHDVDDHDVVLMLMTMIMIEGVIAIAMLIFMIYMMIMKAVKCETDQLDDQWSADHDLDDENKTGVC